MAAKRYRASAHFPSLGDDAHQTVIVEAGNWAAAMGLAARRLKTLAALKRKQIKTCSIQLQLEEGGADTESSEPSEGSSSEGSHERTRGDTETTD